MIELQTSRPRPYKSQPNVPSLPKARMSCPKSTKDFHVIPIPQRLRYDPEKPFQFGLGLNLFLAFSCTFTVANLYYCQPLLIQISEFFEVSYIESSKAATIIQAGHAVGLIFFGPLGDLLPRRLLILTLTLCSFTLTLCLALVPNWNAFLVLFFLAGLVNILPQVLVSLTVDLAPPSKRAFALSITIAGLILGILIARVFAGLIAEFANWRVVYYFAVGMQGVVLVACYTLIPDYPVKNEDLGYWELIRSMVVYAATEPLLIQAYLVNFLSSACLMNFWVTLTFLLGGEPYHYSTLVIGLFGLIGIFGVCMTPLAGRLLDKLLPWYSSVLATIFTACFQGLLVGAAGINIAPIILAVLGIDIFRQILQVSLQVSIFSISREATARLNAVFVISLFLGQVMGADVGSRVFLEYGWRAGAGLSLGWTGLALLILLVRGPHCERKTWFGYQGGFRQKKVKQQDEENGLEEVDQEGTSSGR
ncbi:major facilitator superfamily domain-containing protein [Armillaria novae-zelandiae]|uniref:Major facilitator superfamily domain-containing protein n=1 Tax=Armillaria novae-zelandiae TaxID=153914 RepID=A0AA39PTT7_9AGAR|nr:major facilitator superfamily domain-containing protein [Armillaria novae-zelandiae]